jgi:rhamnose utilization protein RhaD (predicted bifunctional aldolase and dehydrogenase)
MAINHQTISQMCADLGKDPLLVQGAGGNVSWKENETLWIKGSGTWLANANDEDIFVPVNFKHLQDALSNQDFEVKPELIGEHILRPSI